jgi:preprotein translocase subunit YajC
MGTFEIILLVIISLLFIYILFRPSRESIARDRDNAVDELKECLEVLRIQQEEIESLTKDSITDMNIIQQHISNIQSLETQLELFKPSTKNNKL